MCIKLTKTITAIAIPRSGQSVAEWLAARSMNLAKTTQLDAITRQFSHKPLEAFAKQ